MREKHNFFVYLKRMVLFFILAGVFLAHAVICILATYSEWEVFHDLGQKVSFGEMLWSDGIMWIDVFCVFTFLICAVCSLFKYRKGKKDDWDLFCGRMKK